MDRIEKIKRILEGKDPIFLSVLSIDNAENTVLTIDPAGRKVSIDQIIINGVATTGTLTARLYPTFPDGLTPALTDYTLVIPIGECQNVMAGDELEIDRPMDLTIEDSVNENLGYTIEIRWHEKEVIEQPLLA